MSMCLTIPAPSFIDYLLYDDRNGHLDIILRKTSQRYRIKGITPRQIDNISNAKNKGSYVAITFFHSKNYIIEKIDPVPAPIVAQVRRSNTIHNWLAK